MQKIVVTAKQIGLNIQNSVQYFVQTRIFMQVLPEDRLGLVLPDKKIQVMAGMERGLPERSPCLGQYCMGWCKT